MMLMLMTTLDREFLLYTKHFIHRHSIQYPSLSLAISVYLSLSTTQLIPVRFPTDNGQQCGWMVAERIDTIKQQQQHQQQR